MNKDWNFGVRCDNFLCTTVCCAQEVISNWNHPLTSTDHCKAPKIAIKCSFGCLRLLWLSLVIAVSLTDRCWRFLEPYYWERLTRLNEKVSPLSSIFFYLASAFTLTHQPGCSWTEKWLNMWGRIDHREVKELMSWQRTACFAGLWTYKWVDLRILTALTYVWC